MLAVIAYIFPRSSFVSQWWAVWVIEALVVFLLIRYLSTSYRIDDIELRAWKILGGRRVRLERVQRIEYASLRDLRPVGFFGSWGWRGRMWSPAIGQFDSVYTDPAVGLLISEGNVPVYISPRSPDEFARELSRRVRSYTGRLAADVGDPLGVPPPPVR